MRSLWKVLWATVVLQAATAAKAEEPVVVVVTQDHHKSNADLAALYGVKNVQQISFHAGGDIKSLDDFRRNGVQHVAELQRDLGIGIHMGAPESGAVIISDGWASVATAMALNGGSWRDAGGRATNVRALDKEGVHIA